VIRARSENAFVPDALATGKLHQAAGENLHNANQDNCEKLAKKKLVPNLPAEDVFVIANEPYYNVNVNKIPIPSSRKCSNGYKTRILHFLMTC
jgi:hypothetical protein